MNNFRLSVIVAILTLLLIGGVTPGSEQDKPPLLNSKLISTLGQTPPLLGQVPPPIPAQTPPPGQVPPPVPAQTPPPPGQVPSPVPAQTPPPPGQVPPPVPAQTPQIYPSVVIPQQISNASLAVITAKKVKTYLTAGKIWTKIAPRGEVEIKVALIYEGIAVAVIHFSQLDGSPLPLGMHPIATSVSPQIIEKVRNDLLSIMNNIEVLNGSEYREPENAWVVPLSYKGMIIGHLKIYGDGIHVIPDYPANQEMQMYGR